MEASFDEYGLLDFSGEGLDELIVSAVYFTTTTAELIMKSPALGNIEQLKNGLREASNVAGEVKVIQQSYWPVIYKVSWTFDHICPTDSAAILTFLRDTLGQQMTVSSHDGHQYSGIMLTPAAELTRGHSDNIKLEFEGTRV